MTTWTSDELNTIGTAEELELASLRRDGTLRTPVTMWVVRLGDDLYGGSYRGCGGSWFRAAQVRHEGRIRAGGVEKDVTFVEKTDPGINDQIDAAYGAKYRRYGARFVNLMVAPEARAATIQLVPRSTSSSFNNHKEELGLKKHLPLFLLAGPAVRVRRCRYGTNRTHPPVDQDLFALLVAQLAYEGKGGPELVYRFERFGA